MFGPTAIRSRLIVALMIPLLLPIDSALAAGAQRPVKLMPRWKKGDKLRFEMVKSRRKSEAGKPPLEATTRTDLEVEVIKADKSGFVLRWATGEVKFDDQALAAVAGTPEMASLVKGSEVILELDAQGSITGVQNWEEIKASYITGIEAMFEQGSKAGEGVTIPAEIRNQTLSMFNSKEQIEMFATSEASFFFLDRKSVV
jgi:hypothetical protein